MILLPKHDAPLVLFGGSAGAVAFGAFSALVLSHFVTPKLYGIYQALETLTIVFSIGGAWAIEKAFYVSHCVRENRAIVTLGYFAIGFSACLACAIFLIGAYLGVILSDGVFWLAVVFVFVGTLLRSLTVLARAYHVAQHNYLLAAIGDLSNSVVLFVSRTVAGVLHSTVSGLIVAGVLGPLCAAMIMLRSLPVCEIRRKRLRTVFRKHHRYVLVESWGGFLRPLGQRGLVLVLVPTYGPADAALVGLALLLLLQPLQVVVGAFVDIIRSRLKYDPNQSLKLIVGVLVLTPLPLLIAVLTLQGVTPYILGNAWQEVPQVATYIAPLVYAMMAARALQALYSQFKWQTYALLIDAVIAMGGFGMLWFGWALGLSIEDSFLLLGVLLTTFMLSLSYHFCRNEVWLLDQCARP